MSNKASSSTGSSPPSSVFCSKHEIHTDKKESKEHMENVLEEYLQKGREVQKRLNETTELHGQQKMDLGQIIADLQTKLMEVKMERAELQDARQKESQSQENVKMHLKDTIQELEAANQLQEEMLREADSQTEHLKKMVHSHEEVLLELRSVLMDYKASTGKKLYEHENTGGLHIYNLSTAFAGILRDLDLEVSHLKEKVVLVEETLESLKKDSQSQNQLVLQQRQNRERRRTQNSEHTHQVGHSESMVSQLFSELQEAKRVYEDKVEHLEKQLHLAHCGIAEAQTEQKQHSQESRNLSDQISHLLTELRKKERELHLEKEQNKRFWDLNTDNTITIDHLRRELDTKAMQLQCMENTMKKTRMECHRQMERQMALLKERNERVGRISSLTAQLESTKEKLREVQEDLTAKQTELEEAEQTVSSLTACLQEKERALEAANNEVEKLHSQLGSRMQELQHLQNDENHLHSVQSECETLKLQMSEKEKIVEIFEKQVDTMTQIVGQCSRTAGAMEVEKSQLIKEISDWKLKAEELKWIAKDEKEARIHEMEARRNELELEKVKLVNSCTERLHALNDMKLEKDQLMNELQASRCKLAGLAEEFEDLKTSYEDKIKGLENTADRLKMHLKSVQAELEQTRTALWTLEGSDGNALKVAVGMQKKITAKRRQIDALQSKIKFLEEAMTSTAKEKHCLREENSKLSQELSCITAENTKIAGELEILRSQDKRLKEKISKMETALDKASLRFAECQCIIQCQEQEAMRFRLQHTLDVKELQGPGYSSASASGKLRHRGPLPCVNSAVLPPSLKVSSYDPCMPCKPGVLKEEPLQDLKRILQQLTSSSSSNDNVSVDLGRDNRNVGEKPIAIVRNTVDTASRDTEILEEMNTYRWDPSCVRATHVQSQDVPMPLTSCEGASSFSAAPPCKLSPKKVSLEERFRERSPVHMLLTSPPSDLTADPRASPEYRLSTGQVGFPEGAATATQIASQPTGTSEDTPRGLQNKMQRVVEALQIRKQAVSSVIRAQELKAEKARKKKKLSKVKTL